MKKAKRNRFGPTEIVEVGRRCSSSIGLRSIPHIHQREKYTFITEDGNGRATSACSRLSTSLSGKWNLAVVGSLLEWGFEELYGCEDLPSNYFNPALRCLKIDGFRQLVMHNREVVSKFPDGYYITDAINDHAVEMIEQFGRDENPFPLMCPILRLIVPYKRSSKILNGTEENS